MNAYQVTGPTEVITATAVSSEISITPTESIAPIGGAMGAKFFKITNGSETETVFFQTGLVSQTAVAPTAGVPGSTPIPAYGEIIVQVAASATSPATIFCAAVAASSTPVYVTPVMVAGF